MTNLECFEPTLQLKVIKAMIEDLDLFKRISKIVDQNAFDTKTLRLIVTVIADYYKKNGYVPSYTSLQVECLMKASGDRDEILKTISAIKGTSIDGIDSVMEMAVKFFKLKYLVAISNQVLDRVKKGDDQDLIMKQALNKLENLMSDGNDDGIIRIRMTEDVIREAMMETDEDSTIPTGIKELDEQMCGGLGRKEIGLFVAPTGYGKTTAGTIFANNAARLGYNALQIFFEDKPTDIVRKHLACVTGHKVNSFKKLGVDEASVEVKSISEGSRTMLSDHLFLSKMKDGQTTVEDIEMEIRSYMNNYGFKPDVLIIDYFSSLKHSSNPTRNMWDAQASAMRKIKELAFKYDMAVWVLQQTNRTGISKEGDSSGMGNIQGSFEATQPVSVWLTLQRTKEQKQNFRADIIFNKTRHSQPKEDLLNIKFDNSTLQIDCNDIEDDELMYIDNDEYKVIINNNK